MSLLADLLSKIKQPQPKREVPPNLKSIVQSSANRSAARRKTFIISGLIFLLIFSGIVVVYFVSTISEKSEIGMMPPQTSIDPKPSVKASGTEGNAGTEKKASSVTPAKARKKKTTARKQKAKPVEVVTAKADLPENSTDTIVEPPKEIDAAARDELLYKAKEFEGKKDYSAALGAYKKALDIDRENVSILNSIAYIYLKLGFVQESIRYGLMAEEIDVNYSPTLINLGIAYAKTDNIAAAEYYLERAYKMEPDSRQAIFNLALLNERKQDFASASEYYMRLIRLGDPAGDIGLARVYELQGRNKEAMDLYKKAIILESLDRNQRLKIRQRIMILQNQGVNETDDAGPTEGSAH
jgi:Flp pilus assembly protein TadD